MRATNGKTRVGVLMILAAAVTVILICAVVSSGAQAPQPTPAEPPPVVQAAPPAPVAAPAAPQPPVKRPLVSRLLAPSREWLAYYELVPADTVQVYYNVAALLDVIRAQQTAIKDLMARVEDLEKRLADIPKVPVGQATYDGGKTEGEKK